MNGPVLTSLRNGRTRYDDLAESFPRVVAEVGCLRKSKCATYQHRHETFKVYITPNRSFFWHGLLQHYPNVRPFRYGRHQRRPETISVARCADPFDCVVGMLENHRTDWK